MNPRPPSSLAVGSALVFVCLTSLSSAVPAAAFTGDTIRIDEDVDILGSSQGPAAPAATVGVLEGIGLDDMVAQVVTDGEGTFSFSVDPPALTEVSADFVLWQLGDRESVVRDLIASRGLGTVRSVADLRQLGNARSLVMGDLPISAPGDFEAATEILEHLRLGKPTVVLGTGKALRRHLGIPSEQPDASIMRARQEMRVHPDGTIYLDSTSPVSDATPEWERIYVAGIYSDGSPYQLYYLAAPTEFHSALRRVLEWSVAQQGPKSQEGPMFGVPSGPPSPEPMDSIGTDWINHQVEDWFIDIPEMEQRTRIKRLKLNDIFSDRDWYLIDVNIDTFIKDYRCPTFAPDRCGWWVHRRTHTNELDLYDEKFHQGFLDEYGPPTDTSDHATTSYSIGANLNSSSVGGSATVSRTVNKPAVFITAQRSFADDWVRWIEDFRGPDYMWWPWISEPASASHNAYYTDHDTIARGTGGASTTPNGIKVQVDAQSTLYKDDHFASCWGIFLCWWRWTLAPSVSGPIFTDIYRSLASLLYPSNGAQITSRTPTLDWSGPSDADYWYIEIWRSGWSSSAYVSSSQWTTPLLAAGYRYWWKTWSRSKDGVWGYATPARSFTVR